MVLIKYFSRTELFNRGNNLDKVAANIIIASAYY